MAFRLIPVFVDTGIFLSFFLRCLSFRFKTVGGGLRAGSSESRSSSSIGWYVCILDFYFYCLSFKVKVVGGGPTCQSLFFACAKKSNQKKAHNLTKIDPEITYSLWDSRIQYILAAAMKTFFTRPSCSSISELASSQYHSDSSDFSKHKEATTNKFSRLLFILEQVKTVPNGRFLLLSSACRSKKKRTKKERKSIVQ